MTQTDAAPIAATAASASVWGAAGYLKPGTVPVVMCAAFAMLAAWQYWRAKRNDINLAKPIDAD